MSYDPVSTALAKIARGRAADFADVHALITQGHLQRETLEAALEEILSRVAAGQALKITTDAYREKMATFLATLPAQGD